MEVHLGLVHSRRWWSDTSEAWLDELTTTSMAVATELHARYKSSPSLKGFYLTPEIDNLTWCEGARACAARRPLPQARSQTTSRASTRALVASEAPFFNVAFQQPAEYGKVVGEDAARNAQPRPAHPAGRHRREPCEPDQAVEYFGALRDACKATGRTLWSDLEIFDHTRDGGGGPADMTRVAAQLAAEAPLVERVVFWEWGSNLSPSKSRESRVLCADYVKYLGIAVPPALARRAGAAARRTHIAAAFQGETLHAVGQALRHLPRPAQLADRRRRLRLVPRAGRLGGTDCAHHGHHRSRHVVRHRAHRRLLPAVPTAPRSRCPARCAPPCRPMAWRSPIAAPSRRGGHER